MRLAKLRVKRRVTCRYEFIPIESEHFGDVIDPVPRTLEFHENADRSFVESNLSFSFGKFRPEFFVAEYAPVPQTREYQFKSVGIAHLKFNFLAGLVRTLLHR